MIALTITKATNNNNAPQNFRHENTADKSPELKYKWSIPENQ